MNKLNRILEKIDLYKGFNFVHSIAGGTGSGLLSRVIEEIRNRYPKTCISTYSIFPFSTGENSIQNYNSLFTLSWLQKYSDIINYFSNDELLKNKDISTMKKYNFNNDASNSSFQYSMKNMNQTISHWVSGLFTYGNIK